MSEPGPAGIVRGQSLRELATAELVGLHNQLESELCALADELDLVETELNARY